MWCTHFRRPEFHYQAPAKPLLYYAKNLHLPLESLSCSVTPSGHEPVIYWKGRNIPYLTFPRRDCLDLHNFTTVLMYESIWLKKVHPCLLAPPDFHHLVDITLVTLRSHKNTNLLGIDIIVKLKTNHLKLIKKKKVPWWNGVQRTTRCDSKWLYCGNH